MARRATPGLPHRSPHYGTANHFVTCDKHSTAGRWGIRVTQAVPCLKTSVTITRHITAMLLGVALEAMPRLDVLVRCFLTFLERAKRKRVSLHSPLKRNCGYIVS